MPPCLPKQKNAAIVPLLLKWFVENARDLPWRRTTDPYGVYVSEIMLQQTQVKTVIPFWERWMRELPDLASLAAASSGKLHKLWEGLGYYTRVRNMQKAARMVLERHGGVFPERFEEVLALPGIGRYTAGAICSICYNQPRPILDGNVIRVLARVFAIAGDARDKETNATLWALAEDLVTRAGRRERTDRHVPATAGSFCSHFNQSLMELGAIVCTPRNPVCGSCPLVRQCAAFRQNRVHELPWKSPRAKVAQRHFVAVVIERRGKFLVRQRPAGVVNGELWEFPNVEFDPRRQTSSDAAEALCGIEGGRMSGLFVVKHSITRYRITLEVLRADRVSATTAGLGGRWLPAKRLAELPFSSAHKRIVHRIFAGIARRHPGGGTLAPGTDEEIAITRRPVTATRRVPHGSEHPSALVLP